MKKITTSQMTAFQNLQESAMNQICTIGVYSGSTVDAYGQPIETWTSSASLICGVSVPTTKVVYKPDFQLIQLDSIIRLPIDTTVTSKDRITTGSIIYSIVGDIKKGWSCILCDVKRVTT